MKYCCHEWGNLVCNDIQLLHRRRRLLYGDYNTSATDLSPVQLCIRQPGFFLEVDVFARRCEGLENVIRRTMKRSSIFLISSSGTSWCAVSAATCFGIRPLRFVCSNVHTLRNDLRNTVWVVTSQCEQCVATSALLWTALDDTLLADGLLFHQLNVNSLLHASFLIISLITLCLERQCKVAL